METVKTTKFPYHKYHFVEDLKKYPENKKLVPNEKAWNDRVYFGREYFTNPDSHLYLGLETLFPSAEETCRIIKECGGLVFIPHVFAYGDVSMQMLHEMLDELPIDGVECYYPSYTQEQQDYLLNLCSERNLLISGGSDYHGISRPNKLGSPLPPQEWFNTGD